LSKRPQTPAQIRDRWLPSTRVLGDLNNLTTDFPAAEAAALRTDSPSERDANERRLSSMDSDVAAAELAYRPVEGGCQTVAGPVQATHNGNVVIFDRLAEHRAWSLAAQGSDVARTDRLGHPPQVTLALHAREHAAKVLVAPVLFHSAQCHGGLLHTWLDMKRSHAR